jgi:hypothetical protein
MGRNTSLWENLTVADKEICIVGIRTPSGALVKAFDVCVKGEDVYVNYSDSSVAAAHGSYHASGQQHIKIDREYVKWTGGLSGEMEPMKIHRARTGLVSGRNDFWTIGWKVSRLETILSPLENADMTVDARTVDDDLILGFEVSVVGTDAKNRDSIVGFPIIASHCFGNSLRVEIVAFTLTEREWEPRVES